MRKNIKSGISLIVLVITIIVMIILAAAVIISLENTGVIDAAENAVCMTNIKQAQNLAVLKWAELYTKGERDTEVIKEKIKEEFNKNKLNADDYNIEVTTGGVEVSSKAGCTDSSGVEGGNGGSDVVATNWEVAYAYNKATNEWTEYSTNEGTEPTGDFVVKLYKTGNTVIPSILGADEILTLPEGDAYKMEVIGSGEMPDLGTNTGDEIINFRAWQIKLEKLMSGESSELPKTMYVTEVEVDQRITTIGTAAFMYFVALEEITVSSNLTRIGDYAFTGCHKSNFTIPDTVSYVGASAFHSARINMSVTPSNLTTIGKESFNSCILVNDTLTIASTVKTIESDAFCSVKNLKTLNILSAETIGSLAFNVDGGTLETVILPVNLKEIEPYAFDGCKNLKNVYYRGTEAQWANIEISGNQGGSNINDASIRTYEYKD